MECSRRNKDAPGQPFGTSLIHRLRPCRAPLVWNHDLGTHDRPTSQNMAFCPPRLTCFGGWPVPVPCWVRPSRHVTSDLGTNGKGTESSPTQ
ncbi:hypothetical protein COCVIDRAFT_90650 [Bipolaris victoriae FI3]|uniref:Uncharacterized protein n=1 Tax=Bipolaris victoriae (strain FI3) TaxID=930091 RepID=W7ET24_BIPV3|nr:hypothetical protein COCVIDRAFT_90650 [Bipolaris victoriae FI3]